MPPDAFITLTTLHDPMRAEMLRELLSRQGIPAAVPGAFHRGLLGLLGSYIAIPLQVPARHERRARALLREFSAPERGWEVIDEHGRRAAARSYGFPEGDDDAGPERPRVKRIAAFLAAGVTFGTGHIYARATTAGLLLLLAELAVLAIGLPGESALPFLSLPFLVAVDLLGGVRAVARYNAGQPPSTIEQLLRTAPLAAAAVLWALAGAGPEAPLTASEAPAPSTQPTR